MSRKIKFSIGEYYHVYNRGTDKREIFMDKYDYSRFLLLLKICNSNLPIDIREMKRVFEGEAFGNDGKTFVDIGAYCLMPNHFHILFREKVENGISKFIQKLSTAYTMYFNKKYERNGSLFQGVFKNQHIDSDEYLKYIYSYIHLNPVKLIQSDWKEKGIQNMNEACNFLNDYKYSSYLDYLNFNKSQDVILNKKSFPEYFESKQDFKSNLNDWLRYNSI